MSEQIVLEKKTRNKQFELLYVLAISFTVMGHISANSATLESLFVYDSFHMPLFMFISGYFFKQNEWSQTKEFLKKQLLRLYIPFWIWHVIYAGVAVILYYKWGIVWTHIQDFKYMLFVQPFTYGNAFFELNGASWFILVLFEVKIINWFLQLFLRKLKCNHTIVFLVYFILACIAVQYARFGTRTAFCIMITRAFYLMFWYETGYYYKIKLEKKDTLNHYAYFFIILVLRYILIFKYGEQYITAYVFNSEFLQNPIVTILSAATGIAFFLRVARILAPSFSESKLVSYISTHTFSIMMHHILAYFILNLLFYYIGIALGDTSFDFYQLQTTVIAYQYLPNGMTSTRILYFLFGMGLPLMGCKIYESLRDKFKSNDMK